MTQAPELNLVDDIDLELAIDSMRQTHAKTQSFSGEDLAGSEDGQIAGMKGQTTNVFVSIYNAQTGVVSNVTKEMALTKLRQRYKKGQLAGHPHFTRNPLPGKTYKTDPVTGFPVMVGGHPRLCYFHPDSDERERMDSIGLDGVECEVDNIPNDYQLQLHLRRRHLQAWETIGQSDQRQRDDRLLALQEQQTAAMRAMAGQRDGYACDECEHEPFPTQQGLRVHKGRDHK